MDKMDELEKKLDDLIEMQVAFGDALDDMQKMLDRVKKKQIMESPLGMVEKALEYHHSMVQGWTRLVEDGRTFPCTPENMQTLYVALARMYVVVTQYEYVSQILLGINPSLHADLRNV